MKPDNNITVLTGNGLSVAFNPELELGKITSEVIKRIKGASGDKAVQAMQSLAERALEHGERSDKNFENLVGVFGSESRNLEYLRELAELVSPSDQPLEEAINKTIDFAEQVRDQGVSHVLEVISERSTASNGKTQNLHALIKEIVEGFKGEIFFGNLNYDTLILASLIQLYKKDIADMGDGRKERVSFTVDKDAEGKDVKEEFLRLRENPEDFPRRRIKLLHLHGSLTYWGDPQTSEYGKIEKNYLDENNQWEAIRRQATNVRPLVVLANQREKTEHVTQHPFKLAYQMFSDGLADSDHWLIIGYSFRDGPVNHRLRNAFIRKDVKPKVMVVTYGDLLAKNEVEHALGWGAEDGPSDEWLIINREGANGVQESEDWLSFIDAKPPTH